MMDITQKYNREIFLSFLQDNFLPDDFEPNKENVYINKKNAVIADAVKLGVCHSLDISIYEFKHHSRNDPRVTLSRESFSILKNSDTVSNALAVFYNEDSSQWRLSLITSDYTVNEKQNRAERSFSNPRRYSYLLGEGCKRHTPESVLFTKGKIKSIDDLVGRFAIDVVTKKFYSELFNWYDTFAMPLVKFPEGNGAKVTLTQTDNNLHLIRFITRLIFVWFIKQKDLIPLWIFQKDDVDGVLNNFDPYSNKKGNYYNGIIQNLFFATLNRATLERKFTDDDRSKHYGIKTLYRDHTDAPMFAISKKEFIKKFEKVPFLNGGLFECLDRRDGDERQEYHDGFSRESKRSAFVPNCLFWGSRDGTQEGIIELFNRYNFTVEENTPQDVDIALDPELLGKVFENLLGTFNPETQETARNESGSFYTPREIVDYMVDTSLKAYLKDKLSSGKTTADIEPKLETLFSYKDEVPDLTEHQITTIIEAINNCKIIDPACGSGAFPMGILHKLVYILGKLDPDNSQWRELQRKNALQQMDEALHIIDKQEREQHLREIDDIFESNASDYGRKLYLIENCLFGVDIQPIAIQITKLRFFISLIVDQKTTGAKEDNYGILPLPNLETKFVAANTLIGVKKKDDAMALFENPDIEKLQTELLEIRHKHFSAKTAKQKISLREKDREVCARLARLLEEQHYYTNEDAIQMADWDPYNQNRHSDFFDPYWMFGIRDGFDVVIGNPPYGADIDDYVKLFEDLYPETSHGFKDIYKYFFEKCLSLLSKHGCLSFITPNTFLRQPRYGDLRRLLLKYNIRLLVDLGEHIFEAVVPTAITLVSRIKDKDVYFADLTKSLDAKSALKDISFNSIEQSSYEDTPNNIFIKDIRKKKDNEVLLNEILEMKDAGINYQRVDVGLADKGNSDLSKRLLYEGKREQTIDIEYWKGVDINSYFIAKHTQRYVRPNTKLKQNERVILNRDYFHVFPKLLWRQTAPHPIATIDEKGIWFGRSIQAGVIKEEYKKLISYKYLCALLNSKYLRFLYENTVKEEGRVFPQVKLEKIKSLPIVLSKNQQPLIALVDKIIAAKIEDQKVDTSVLEEKIDKLVYELYRLTAEEIEVVEGKNV
ncbi:hypothetical protein AGMMS49928_13050 [Spirochaetia bacterium]|nr:hypothetical protein AGMMS49928_13050 [Spirochaetia bacterium]